MKHNYSIGEKVVTNNDCIGIIKRITPTGRIVVSFNDGRYDATYRPDGWETGNDHVWSKSFIQPLTDEKCKEISDKISIRQCERLFDKTKLSADQARRILEILVETKSGEDEDL